MKSRAMILIDGSNFYFKLKDLQRNQHLLEFDFKRFVLLLTKNARIVDACYYIGKIRQDGTKKTERLFANQQRLLAVLGKAKVRYSFGYLLKNNGRYHEKGVDVQIATDLLVAAYENSCDKFFLVSSDTDLGPAIKKVLQMGKQIEYVGFSHQPSVAMVSFCSSSRLLTQDDIRRCFEQTHG